MKVYSNDSLLLGGLYGVLSVSSAYLFGGSMSFISDVLFCVFVISAIMLFFNKTPRFISDIQNKFPIISYYIKAVGWIPYAFILGVVLLIVSGFFIEYSQAQIEQGAILFEYGFLLLTAASLLIALIKRKK